ncbi:hypothetical protein DBR43_03200 [Pedobacter sp. KBW06]|uniref:DUF3805 domain-containing protein n=1 Tax=Pedobacter sp. KBW06 TaxID=2153359 RepID=UPI000F5A1635|nr:DUF3805 domain-containing protein [Pedobacter sp. KBW06]RQO74415.1 hypothetical protein DBR43_03200 [Pedobacter sp. KBW06]
MDNNIYILRGGWFSFRLIDGWEEYDDDDSTHAFWHETETSWTGNFRITAFQWPNTNAPHVDKAYEYITTEIAENAGAQRIILGQNDCAYYKKESQQDGVANVVYYWITGKQNDIFICTFTIDKVQESMLINERELTSIQSMITSIKII